MDDPPDSSPHLNILSPHSSFVPFRPSLSPASPTASPSPKLPINSPLTAATVNLVSLYRSCNSQFKFEHLVPRRCLTKPSKGVYNHDWDNSHHDYILYVNDTLADDHGNTYTVLDLLGTGTFGQVVKCRHQSTGEVVAVKIIKNQPAYFNQAWVEISILRMLHRNNYPDQTRHIVKFFSHFVFRGHLCLVFERLSINLYELLKQNNYVGLGLEMLRNFLSQILQALNVLVRSEVIHCDLKPENILIKALDTAQLKIIDFGSACQLHYPVYSYVQSRFYRSPEVLLGWPKYDSKIDMWSLGCVAAELFLGIPLFPGQNEMNMVCRIVEMLGEMPHRFLQFCRHTPKFFNGPRAGYSSHDVHVYSLKPIAQYERETSQTLPEWKRFFKEKKLRDIIMTYPRRTPPPHTDELRLRESLIDLLHGMLKFDPRERWNPAEALQHPFLSGEPLPNGQPWIPPTRLRRVVRSRPVFIDSAQAKEEPGTSADNLYSASAPNFNARGNLAIPSVSSRFAPHPPNAFQPHLPQNPQQRQPHLYQQGQPHGLHQSPAYAYAGHDYPPQAAHPIAPGSYVPPPAPSMFAPVNFPPVAPLPPQRHGHPGSYGPTLGGSHDPRTFLYQPPLPHTDIANSYTQPSQQPSHPASAVIGSPGGALSSTPPVPYAAALRFGSGLHLSASRESLTGSGSLHPSASRESLAMVREASANDLSEDPMFSFGSDDEGFSPSAPHSAGSTAAQPPSSMTGLQQPMELSPGQGASASLPPPGPRPPTSRTSAAYGNPSTLSSYGYTYNSFQQGRTFRPSSGTQGQHNNVQHQFAPVAPSGDTNIADVHPSDIGFGSTESRPQASLTQSQLETSHMPMNVHATEDGLSGSNPTAGQAPILDEKASTTDESTYEQNMNG